MFLEFCLYSKSLKYLLCFKVPDLLNHKIDCIMFQISQKIFFIDLKKLILSKLENKKSLFEERNSGM